MKTVETTRYSWRSMCAPLCLIATFATGMPIAAPAAQSESASSNTHATERQTVEEVVVTAQKREQRVQDVPLSISVIGGDALDKSSLTSVTETLNQISGVVATVAVQGGGTQIAMRGVGASGPLFNGSSPTGYYLDYVPFGLVQTAIAPDADPYDLQRIEVLRGPQGTLYGAGGEGGVVRILTHDPNLDRFEMKARVSGSSTEGGSGNFGADVAVNVPIIEGKLAARAVVGYDNLGGWIDAPGLKDLNAANLRTYRLKIEAQPTEQLSIGLSSWHTRNDLGAPPASDVDQRTNTTMREPVTTDYDANSIHVGYDFPTFALSSATSYFRYENSYLQDIGRFGLPGLTVFLNLRSRIFSQEVLLNSSTAGPWRWTAGLFYRRARDTMFQIIPPGAFLYTDEGDGSTSGAVFGDLSRRFMDDHLEWTLGVRRFHDRVYTRENSLYQPPPGTELYNARASFNSTTPRAVLTWYPRHSVTAYASYSEGFRSGFPQTAKVEAVVQLPPVNPDKLHNYEIGAKGDLAGGLFSFDTAIYYIDWQDVQQTLGVPFDVGGVSACCIIAPVNGRAASGAGVDLGLTTRPVQGLELGATFSWNDLKLDDAIFSGTVQVFAKGDRLNYSSKYTAGAFGNYDFPLGVAGLSGRIAASASYSSPQTNRLLSNGPPTILEGDKLTFVRASFSIESAEHWTATAFVDNLTNEYSAIPGTSPPADLTPRVRPRTVGLQLDYRF